MNSSRARLVPGLALAAVSLALGACSGDDGSETIDAREMEEEIMRDVTADVGQAPASIDCPGDEIEPEEGAVIECTLTAPDGSTGPVEVTLTDDPNEWSAIVAP